MAIGIPWSLPNPLERGVTVSTITALSSFIILLKPSSNPKYKMPFAPELRSHSQKVCTLYKKAMRLIESYYVARNVVRYHQVIMRHEFDQKKCECDPKEQRRLLWLGEHELFMKQNPIPPAKFARSIGMAGGVAFERVPVVPDWILDYWHPLEKAQYPEYFKKREMRKCEYIQKWYDGTLL